VLIRNAKSMAACYSLYIASLYAGNIMAINYFNFPYTSKEMKPGLTCYLTLKTVQGMWKKLIQARDCCSLVIHLACLLIVTTILKTVKSVAILARQAVCEKLCLK